MCGRSGKSGPNADNYLHSAFVYSSCVFSPWQGLNSWMDGLTSGPTDNGDTGRRQGWKWHVVMSRCSQRSLDEVVSCRSLVYARFIKIQSGSKKVLYCDSYVSC